MQKGFRSAVKAHRTLLVFVILALFSTGSIMATHEGMARGPVEAGMSLVSTFQGVFSSVGDFFASTVTSVRQLSRLREDYDGLLARFREYETLEQDIEALQRENELLREALDFSERLGMENVPAKIIGRAPDSLYSTITINRGRTHGVDRDMPVVAVQDGNQGLVGKTVEAGRYTAKIRPLLDPSFHAAAMLRESRYQGLVSGTAASDPTVTMRYVESDAADRVTPGEMVITSGLESIFPQGIHIGRVHDVSGNPYDTSIELKVESLIDLTRLEYVFVAREVEAGSEVLDSGTEERR